MDHGLMFCTWGFLFHRLVQSQPTALKSMDLSPHLLTKGSGNHCDKDVKKRAGDDCPKFPYMDTGSPFVRHAVSKQERSRMEDDHKAWKQLAQMIEANCAKHKRYGDSAYGDLKPSNATGLIGDGPKTPNPIPRPRLISYG